MQSNPQHICLIGGGHAHLAVLEDWIRNGIPAARATLLTPHPSLRYSGMVPGWISGQYAAEAGLVDLEALSRRAGVECVFGKCVSIDPVQRWLETDTGDRIPFDMASLDTGGVGKASDLLGNDPRILDIRPIDRFVDDLAKRRRDIPHKPHIAVVGGGAGGVELAFALRNLDGAASRPVVTLAAGSNGLLPDFSSAVRTMVARELARQGIGLIEADAHISDGALMAGEQSIEPLDLIAAALGSGAADWPQEGGLACDADGFVAVDRFQRSTSHPHVLAVGDVAARQDREVPHSGVHAVFAGPILADNLRAIAQGMERQRSYRPRRAHLYLISTGDGSAIASYGPFCAKGRWVAALKHWIDTRWIERYARLGSEM